MLTLLLGWAVAFFYVFFQPLNQPVNLALARRWYLIGIAAGVAAGVPYVYYLTVAFGPGAW